MIQYPAIDPVIFEVGPFAIRWYGMMYLFGFVAAFLLGRRRARLRWSPLKPEHIEDLIFYCALGAVLGGRVGYVFFYGFDRFLDEPLWLFKIWEGGMAFHGGLLGVFVALILYAKRLGVSVGAMADFVAPLAPIGLGLGRLANFINGELWGRNAEVPWAMVFPTDPGQLPRHPSQLYQAFFEGVILLLVVLWFARKRRPDWSVAAVFLIAYGVGRFAIEFFREPDAGLAFDWMTRGQLLSTPMIVGGIILFWLAYRLNKGAEIGVDTASNRTEKSNASAAARTAAKQTPKKKRKKSAK